MGAGSVALANVIQFAAGALVNNPSGGYGNNMLFGNNGGNTQVFGGAVQLHPNVCQPACP